MRWLTRRALLAGTMATCASTPVPILAAGAQELRLGLTPVFLSSDVELLETLKAYLEKRTGLPVRLITRRTYQEITSLLISGQLDAAWICGFPFVVNRPKLALVAVPLWQGRPLYRSYLITGGDRRAAGLDDLKGDVHAFSDPDSNSGWLVTAAALARRGLSPERFFGQTIYTYGHRNVVRAVAAGLTMSGSIDGYVYEVMREIEPELVGQTRIVQQSALFGFPPVACSVTAVDDPRVLRLRSALVQMHEDEKGRAVLRMLRLDGFGVEEASLFDPIAEEVALVRGGG